MLMAHPQHGFTNVGSGEVESLKARGWELCDDPIEYKRRVWGIDYSKPAVVESIAEPVELSTEAERVEYVADVPKRRGRPRKAE